MRNTKAYIVSDSSLLCSSLERSIQINFTEVICKLDIDSVHIDNEWKKTVLIIDATYPDKIVYALKKLSLQADLSRAIILMRGSQSLHDFREVLGLVGGILPNSCTVEEVAMVACIVRRGLLLAPSELLSLDAGLEMPLLDDDRSDADLTDQENRVLACICEGAGNKIIARKLEISDSTVRVHVRSILRKLGLQNRTQAALYAVGRFRKSLPEPAFNFLALASFFGANGNFFLETLNSF